MSEPIISVSGVRGLVGDSLTPAAACDLGMAFAALLAGGGKSGPVAVGRDSRPSGRMVEQAVCAGLLGSGLSVRPLGVVATPTCSLAVRDLSCIGGVMITASHNPAPYNGLKFMHADGQCLSGESMARLAILLRNRSFRHANHSGEFRIEPDGEATERHVRKVLSCIDVESVRKARLAVLLDSVNGAGGPGAVRLLDGLGCRALLDHTEPTGRFPRTPEPTAENVQDVCRRAAESAVAVALVQDPDADRLALIDESGRYVGEEYTLVLAARCVLEGGRKGPIATNLSTSRMIDHVAARAGVHLFRTPVGEANVAAKMAEQSCVLAGEGNGGVIDPRVGPVRDSLAGIALVLELLARTGKPLSKLVGEVPRYHMVKKKYPVPPDGVGPMLVRVAAAGQGALVNDADGIRIDWPEGWVHVRASNTEPAYRVIAEGRDAQDTEKILAHVAAAVAGQLAQP